MHLPPAEPIQLAAASRLLVNGRCLVKGISCQETTGTTAAAFRIFDGSTGGLRVLSVTLAANESIREWYGEAGVVCRVAVFEDQGSGSYAGTLWVIPESSFEGQSFPSEWLEGNQ